MPKISGRTPHRMVITIDGPAGSGKSTASRMLARQLGYVYLDTGAMYRAVGLQAEKEGISLEDEEALDALCKRINIFFQGKGEEQSIFCQGEDFSKGIREPRVGWIASTVSLKAPVRKAMVRLQRQIGARGGVVAEGRDTGTVVFPHAEFKFFLIASPRERARRRHLEFKAKGNPVNLEEVEKEIQERDKQDSSRELAPLRPAPDSHTIDSTGLSPEEVVETMMEVIKRGAEGSRK